MVLALAAALFTVLTLELQSQLVRDGASGADAIRIIEAITVGVSFLAPGTIIHSGRDVRGLTTGAGMWLAGAVGLACGLERYALAMFGALMAILILAVLIPVESWIARSAEKTPEEPPQQKQTKLAPAATRRPSAPRRPFGFPGRRSFRLCRTSPAFLCSRTPAGFLCS